MNFQYQSFLFQSKVFYSNPKNVTAFCIFSLYQMHFPSNRLRFIVELHKNLLQNNKRMKIQSSLVCFHIYFFTNPSRNPQLLCLLGFLQPLPPRKPPIYKNSSNTPILDQYTKITTPKYFNNHILDLFCNNQLIQIDSL